MKIVDNVNKIRNIRRARERANLERQKEKELVFVMDQINDFFEKSNIVDNRIEDWDVSRTLYDNSHLESRKKLHMHVRRCVKASVETIALNALQDKNAPDDSGLYHKRLENLKAATDSSYASLNKLGVNTDSIDQIIEYILDGIEAEPQLQPI